jgi:hypothetical protein
MVFMLIRRPEQAKIQDEMTYFRRSQALNFLMAPVVSIYIKRIPVFWEGNLTVTGLAGSTYFGLLMDDKAFGGERMRRGKYQLV